MNGHHTPRVIIQRFTGGSNDVTSHSFVALANDHLNSSTFATSGLTRIDGIMTTVAFAGGTRTNGHTTTDTIFTGIVRRNHYLATGRRITVTRFIHDGTTVAGFGISRGLFHVTPIVGAFTSVCHTTIDLKMTAVTTIGKMRTASRTGIHSNGAPGLFSGRRFTGRNQHITSVLLVAGTDHHSKITTVALRRVSSGDFNHSGRRITGRTGGQHHRSRHPSFTGIGCGKHNFTTGGLFGIPTVK